MSMPFDPRNPDTWPNLLTLAQMAAIYEPRTERGIQAAVARRTMKPMPAKRWPRMQWRRLEVERDVFGTVARRENGNAMKR